MQQSSLFDTSSSDEEVTTSNKKAKSQKKGKKILRPKKSKKPKKNSINKIFTCDYCKKDFCTKTYMLIHIKIHLQSYASNSNIYRSNELDNILDLENDQLGPKDNIEQDFPVSIK